MKGKDQNGWHALYTYLRRCLQNALYPVGIVVMLTMEDIMAIPANE